MRKLMRQIRGAATGAWLRRISVAVFIGLFAAATPNLLTPEPQAVAVPGGEPVDYSTNSTNASNYAWAEPNSTFHVSSNATWESWLYPTGRGGAYMDKVNTYTFGVWSGTYHWAIWGNNGTSWVWVNTGIPARFNQWQHVAWVKSGTNLKLYLDGQEVYSANYSGIATLPSRGNFAIQNRTSNLGENFFGRIDEVKIWGKAKSQAEIVADMHNRPTSTTNLQAYFDFNDLQSGWVQNLAPNAPAGSHLRINGDLSPTDVKDTFLPSATDNRTTYVFPRSYITRQGGWRVPSGVTSVDVFAVGGGGGGGGGGSTGYGGGGGGGAQVLSTTSYQVVPGSQVSLVVGQGGRAGRNSGDSIVQTATSGQSTAFGSLTVQSGGSGGSRAGNLSDDPGDGASGGGGALYQTTFGAGTQNIGNSGGLAPPPGTGATAWAGGGGGGVLGPGTSVVTNSGVGGSGGPGVYDASTRTLNFYGAGGSAKGCKGFGSTNFGATAAATDAAANSGSGGGGGGGGNGTSCISAWYSSVAGGWGGSGVVAVSFVASSEAGASDTPAYYPYGPQTNVPLATVLSGGWEICYQGGYEQSPTRAQVYDNCDGEFMMYAGRVDGSPNLTVLAAAPKADVLTDTGTSNVLHNANGVGWYYGSSYSVGFAKEGDPVSRSSCDTNNTGAALKICWHGTTGSLYSGWRLGTVRSAGAGYERLVLTASAGFGSSAPGEACTPITYTKNINGTDYTIHEFVTGVDCGFDIPAGVGNFELYAVGGGGGGGNNVGGGGGGGGSALLATTRDAVGGEVKITVGAGGAGGVNTNSVLRDGQNGSQSIVKNSGNAQILNAAGGVGGQTHWSTNQCSGGSKVGTGGAGGAAGTGGASGGAGGLAANPAAGAPGSSGYSSTFAGDERFFGGGGGGGGWGTSRLGGIGGIGGGGAGATGGSNIVGKNGAPGTGGGGGGGEAGCAEGGRGGSGTVFLRYPSTAATATALFISQPAAQAKAATSESPFVIQPIVKIVDAAGVLVNSNATVTAKVMSGSAEVLVSKSVTAVNGVANFAGQGLWVDRTSPVTIRYESTGLLSATQTIQVMQRPTTLQVVEDASAPSSTPGTWVGGDFYADPSVLNSVLRISDVLAKVDAGYQVNLVTTTGDITITAAISSSPTAGSVSLDSGRDVFINNDIRLSGATSSLEVKAARNIVPRAGTSADYLQLQSNTGRLVLWANSNNNNQGTVLLPNYTELKSNGGDIYIAGGAATTSGEVEVPAGYAVAYDGTYNDGVRFGASQVRDQVRILSGGGDITVRGSSNQSGRAGIMGLAGNRVESGTGVISFSGITYGNQPVLAFVSTSVVGQAWDPSLSRNPLKIQPSSCM